MAQSLWKRTPFALTGLCGLFLAAAPPVHASSFDGPTGRLSIADAPYAVSFEGLRPIPPELRGVFTDVDDQTHEATDMASLFYVDPDGLEGEGGLEFGGEVHTLRLDLDELWSTFAGRRVEIRFWQRPDGTRVRATVQWQVIDAVDPTRRGLMGQFPFQPTGRATDDGWEEWTSGPVDWSLPNGAGPTVLELVDIQQVRSDQWTNYSNHLRVRVDALEIVDLGAAAVPDVSCDGATEEAACSRLGVCLAGRCVDGALRYGPALQEAGLRGDYLDRRLFEFQAFAGSRMAQARMGTLETRVDGIRDETAARPFWSALRGGIAQLRDGHASSPSRGSTAPAVNYGVCLHLGTADLLPTAGTAPLVFSVENENPVGDVLQVGDALTAIDGLAPLEWARAVGLEATHSGDPGIFEVVVTPNLIPFAAGAGSTLTFTRCDGGGDATPMACDASELETVEIDFADLADQTVWAGDLPDWLTHNRTCDYRFRRAVDDGKVRNYDFAGYVDEGDVRILIINGEPGTGYDAGDQWRVTVDEALDPAPAYLILDQRTGWGGAIDTTDFLAGMLVGESAFDRMEIVPWLDRPLDGDLWSLVAGCNSHYCGDFIQWTLHETSQLESAKRGVAASTRLVVLNAFDVSGNDYSTKLINYRAGPTRVIGHGPTHGAFGPRADMASHLDEFWGGSMQYWDTVFLAQSGDPLDLFTTGTGVEPDVTLLQRQSDALRGVDTLIEAAKAWLLQE